MKLYRVHMEGDFGQEGVVFKSEEDAETWAKMAYECQDMEDPFEDFWNDICSVEELETSEALKAELSNLEYAQAKLCALEVGGVDNWPYYYDALKDAGLVGGDE